MPRWKRIVVRIAVWLVAEVVFNLFGIDDIADYGEFVFDRHWHGFSRQPQLAYVTIIPTGRRSLTPPSDTLSLAQLLPTRQTPSNT